MNRNRAIAHLRMLGYVKTPTDSSVYIHPINKIQIIFSENRWLFITYTDTAQIAENLVDFLNE